MGCVCLIICSRFDVVQRSRVLAYSERNNAFPLHLVHGNGVYPEIGAIALDLWLATPHDSHLVELPCTGNGHF